MLAGEVDTGKAILRDYINATIGFAELGAATHRSSKSLMRMFGPNGNPQAANLFEILAYLQNKEGMHLELRCRRQLGSGTKNHLPPREAAARTTG